MLTEGWDANTVTHVLGVRAFGTQLLCEQVIGRALRLSDHGAGERRRPSAGRGDLSAGRSDLTTANRGDLNYLLESALRPEAPFCIA